jgi:hypothetical protein
VVRLLIQLFILSIALPSFGADGEVMRTQGLINPGGSLKTGYVLINEMRVYIDKTTQVLDHRGVSIQTTELKPKRWVYIETVKDPIKKIMVAKKIYLLPHYVNPEQRRKFAFM